MLNTSIKTAIITLILTLLPTLSSAQRTVLDLSGTWQSSLGPCKLPGTTDENRLGPGAHRTDVSTQLTRLYPYKGIVSYERDFELGKDMEGMVLSMEFERTKPSTLWIDGELIGSIRQLYAPHIYSLPSSLKAGRHHIRIDIDNRDEAVPAGVHGSHAWSDATQTNWNGILGRMELVAKPRTHIEDMKLYPDVDSKAVRVALKVRAEKAGKFSVSLVSTSSDDELGPQSRLETKVNLVPGTNELEFTVPMGENVKLWSEFHPNLHRMEARISGRRCSDSISRTFGMRKFSVEGTQFVINGHKTFLRGTHDACVFPLSAYCPTDVEQWRRIFVIAKEYGINHFRFHSYTPTEAAFIAADEEGIYLHTELPLWGTISAETAEQNEFLRHEGFTLLDFLGNHPSFVSLGLGNELWGDNDMMAAWLDEFREADPRHLYSQGSNNDLGWKGPKDGEDFYISCRVGGGEGFSTHSRTSFSFADADEGGILNWNRPGTADDFSNVVALCNTPIVSHENGQFQIYPDYSELPKYTGVLYPYNLEIFRKRLEENGLSGQADAFHKASGKWALECYKADIEYCLRTPGFGGYQLLDIKDYPGQGSALVGILDAFMDSKGLVESEEFRGWNSPVVPMAIFDSYCWNSTDTLRFRLRLCNYSEEVFHEAVTWELGDGRNFTRRGSIEHSGLENGQVKDLAEVSLPLSELRQSTRLKLKLSAGGLANRYNLWVYVDNTEHRGAHSYMLSDTLDASTVKALDAGARVLITPGHSSIERQSVGGLFTPDYWNYAMFKTISENNGKPVSPGTLGMLMDPDHPVFGHFPTDGWSDWQWWSIALNSRPLILNSLDKSYFPIIQTIDNVERNHKLGILMEFKVGKGSVLLSTTDLEAISAYVEGRAYVSALEEYISSDSFNPAAELSLDQLSSLLYSESCTREIRGVKNITEYRNPFE